MRALRCAFTNRPRPGTTNTPFFFVSLIAVSARCSRKVATVLLLEPSFSAKWRVSWVLVIPLPGPFISQSCSPRIVKLKNKSFAIILQPGQFKYATRNPFDQANLLLVEGGD